MSARRKPAAIRTVAETDAAATARHLLATARAFAAAGRQVPGHVLYRLWGVRSSWRGQPDIPAQVTAACQLLDSLRDLPEMRRLLQGRAQPLDRNAKALGQKRRGP